MNTEFSLESQIVQWREMLTKQKAIESSDIDELEDHLRDQIDALFDAGLTEEEAFIVAVKRMGDQNSIGQEFAREYSERLWKQFVSPDKVPVRNTGKINEVVLVIFLAIGAAVAIRIPEFFGIHFDGPDANELFYLKNFSLLILPYLAFYFIWKGNADLFVKSVTALSFVALAFIINLFPFIKNGSTEILSTLHLPILMWLISGFAYTGSDWRSHDLRMNFIRFSGEWFIYFVLIAAGGGVLMLFVVFIFESIGIDPEYLVVSWIMPCGAAGAVLITAWLVEAKKSIIENMAPVLTKIFTPLFALLLMTFLLTMLITGNGINVEREVLIGFDFLLVLVLALLLYSISARDNLAAPNFFDLLQLILVVSALLVDVLALLAIINRISTFGFSPNKVAALGLNIILLINLGWSAVLLSRFWLNKIQFMKLSSWQTLYVPIYALWAGIVVIIFPLIFEFK